MNLDKSMFIADYIAEAREILDSLDDIAVLAIKEKRNYSYLEEILRLLHTLKGSSRMMDYTQIEKVMNHLENVFKNIQSNQTEISNKVIQLMLGILTVMHKVIDEIESGSDGTFAKYDEIINNIDKAMEDEDFKTDFSQASEYAPSSASSDSANN